jgi:hypothetical protein
MRARFWQRWTLRLEAVFFVALARLILIVLPFRRLKTLLSRPLSGPPAPAKEQAIATAAIQGAILWVWRWGMLRDSCFHRAIAAHLMLRRRRVATWFHYGAATLVTRGLTGHVWLTSAVGPVVGGDQAPDYAPLLCWGPHATEDSL